MRLTPAEVHNVAFKKPSIGKRGYDEDEVDAFLDLVEDELARLILENNELTERIAAYESGGAPARPVEAAPVEAPVQAPPAPVVVETVAAPPPPPPAPVPSGDSHVHAARLLGLAQETADRLTAEASAEAQSTLAQARAESERLLSEATTEAERVRSEATSHSESMVGEAQAKAEATERDSRVKAEALDREAQRQYNEVMSSLTTQKSDLEKKIDDLRTYEREYRSRLKTWISEQLQQLDGNAGEAAVSHNG